METKTQVYEIGYLLTPFLPEEKLPETVDRLVKDVLTKFGGKVVSEVLPKMLALAYPIAKNLGNKKEVFRDAYFGAVKFEGNSEICSNLLVLWRGTDEIVRFLVTTNHTGGLDNQFVVNDKHVGTEGGLPLAEPGNRPTALENSDNESKKAIDAVIDREIADLLIPVEPHVS